MAQHTKSTDAVSDGEAQTRNRLLELLLTTHAQPIQAAVLVGGTRHLCNVCLCLCLLLYKLHMLAGTWLRLQSERAANHHQEMLHADVWRSLKQES